MANIGYQTIYTNSLTRPFLRLFTGVVLLASMTAVAAQGPLDQARAKVDLVTESVSFINNYRSSYGEILRKEGFDGLLARMSEKLAELEPNGNSTES